MSKRFHKIKLSRRAGVSKGQIKAGLPPGTLVHVGEKLTEKSRIELISYDKEMIEKKESEVPAKIYPLLNADANHWINIDGLHNIKMIENIGKHFNLHPLLLEDVVNTDQRPKSEEHEGYLFFTLKTLNKITGNEITYEQMSFVLGKNYLISFQEREGDLFDKLRDRIILTDSKLRQNEIDYLFYRLIDTIVDSYYIVLEHVGEQLENLEEKVYVNPTQETLQHIQELKKELIFLRKSVYPLREAVKKTMAESTLIHENTRKYLADVYDHTIQVIETIESYRDLTASLVDIYMTSVSNRMNEVMKVLTIIATIFIPLTFIAGVYGMNFENMPELQWKYGYPAVWLIMISVFIGMLIYFRRRKWL